MTNIYPNHSHKTLQPKDALKASSSVEPPKALAPDRELEPSVPTDQIPLHQIDQPIESTSTIAVPIPACKRWFTPQLVIIASGLIAALLGGAIAANYFRIEQSNKIAAADRLLSETCHTKTLADPIALRTAESGWNTAIAQLQSVPPIPGFGAGDAQAVHSKYAWCKNNIDATKLFQESATVSQAARNAVARSQVLSQEDWAKQVAQLDAAIEHLSLIQSQFGDSTNLTRSLPVFSAAQNRLNEYKGIRAIAQKRQTIEQIAEQNFMAARELYQQFETNQAATDATQRDRAEDSLIRAIAQLKKIPPEGTTVSSEANQLRQTYAQALYTFRTEPARQQLRQLVTSFSQLSSALEAGISAEEFGSNLNTLTDQMGQLPPLSNTRQISALKNFQMALADYRFAQRLLSICAESNDCFTGSWGDNDVYLREDSTLYRTLVDFYRVAPVHTMQGWAIRLRSAQENTALDTILQAAGRKVETASQLVEQ